MSNTDIFNDKLPTGYKAPELTRGQKAAATRKANAAKKVVFKDPTDEERAKGPDRKLLEIADIIKLNMQELVDYAEKMHIDTYAKSKADLLVELGVTQRKGGKIYIRPQPSAEKLRYLIERHYAVPMNTVFPEDRFDDWLKIVALQPMAFNGADLSDKNQEIIHTLDVKNTCVCGAKVVFGVNPDNNDHYPVAMCPGVPGTIKRNGQPMEVQRCLGTDRFRKFMLHKILSS